MRVRPGLDRAAVVRAAAELFDEANGGDVTLAQIAGKLGVRTPSLYNHIGGQDELRQELAICGVRQLRDRMGRAAIGKSGDDAIVAVAHAYRAFAHERPGLYWITLRAPAAGDQELQSASQEALSVLQLVFQHYGLTESAEIHAIRSLRSLIHGFVSLEMAGGFGLPVDIDESFRYLLDMFIRGLRREESGM